MQDKKIVAYKSCKLKYAKMNYSIHEKELLAVIHSLKVWRHYLLSKIFMIKTNHQSLKNQLTKPKLSRRQCRWMGVLQEFDFDIEYVNG